MITYGSMCSGIEAATVAWESLGWKPSFFSEIKPFPCKLLAYHYPKIPNLGDITQIYENQIFKESKLDLLVAGTPCQSFSIAGQRGGLDDPRGDLALEFLRLVKIKQPKWIIWENVAGVLTSNKGRDFGAFINSMGECGYGIAYRILDAQYFGVPQRRRRVFAVGHFGDWRAAAAIFLEWHGLSGYPPPRREARKDVAPTLSARTHGGGGPGTDFDLDGGLIGQLAFGGNNTTGPIDVATTANACASASGRIDFETETFITHSLSADGFDASEDGTGRGVPLIAGTLSTRYGASSGRDLSDSSALLPLAFNLRGREGGAMPEPADAASVRAASGGSSNSYVAFSAKDHGADASDIAPTLRGMGHDNSHANGGGQVAVAFTLHGSDGTASIATPTDVAGSVRTKPPGSIENSSTTIAQQGMAVRRLTPRECERLQGMPDDYTLIPYRGKPAADGPRYRAIGNSMAVPVMRWIGLRIQMVDSIRG